MAVDLFLNDFKLTSPWTTSSSPILEGLPADQYLDDFQITDPWTTSSSPILERLPTHQSLNDFELTNPWTTSSSPILERLPAHQSLCPQIAVHAALLMLFPVSHYFLKFECVLPASSALRSVRRRIFCSRIIRAPSMFTSRTVWTSSSACRRSPASKRDTALCLLVFPFCALLRMLHQVLNTFLHYLPKYLLSCALTTLSPLYVVPLTQESENILRLLLHSVQFYSLSYRNVVLPYCVQFVGMRAIITVALAGQVNSQYYHMGTLSHLNSVALELKYFYDCAVVLPSFTLDSFGRSSSVTAWGRSIFTLILLVELKPSYMSMYLRLLPYYGGKWTCNVVIVLCICVPCRLMKLHETTMWECDRTDIPNIYIVSVPILRALSPKKMESIYFI